MPRSEGPFEVTQKLGNNAYRISFPSKTKVLGNFSIGDLITYHESDGSDEEPYLRSNPFPEGDVAA